MLSRFQLDTLLVISKNKVESIAIQDPSAKLQQRVLKWAAVYFLTSCTMAIRFASKRPSTALIDQVVQSSAILQRETLHYFSPHVSSGSSARLFNIVGRFSLL